MSSASKYAVTLAMAALAILAITTCVASAESLHREEALKLWYDQPATDWEKQALPIGN
jgi:hypothetical protein